MWPGPYGEWGSRKYLLASLDQSLKRMGLDYVDIFYSHRFDPDTPLEETMGALDTAVRQGKALYVGISSYNSRSHQEAAAILKRLGTPCLIHQPSYSMVNRWIERTASRCAGRRGRSAHRLLAAGAGAADRQVSEWRSGRQPRGGGGLPSKPEVSDAREHRRRCGRSTSIAERRGQTLAQMALAWVLRDRRVTTALDRREPARAGRSTPSGRSTSSGSRPRS